MNLRIVGVFAIAVGVLFPAATLANETSEESLCDPVGRVISGLYVEGELICAGEMLPAPESEVRARFVCFTSQSVEEVTISSGEARAVSSICSTTKIFPCGNTVCFAPRGEVAAIEISSSPLSSGLFLDWGDIPNTEHYVIQVGEQAPLVVSTSNTHLDIDTSRIDTISVSALSGSQLVIGYGVLSLTDEDEGRPISRVVE